MHRSLGLVLGGALLLTACGEGDAEREDMIRIFEERAELSEADATCIADEIYGDTTWTQEQLNAAAKDPATVPGFQDALDAAIAGCL